MAHRGSPRPCPEHAKRHVIGVPLRRIHVANTQSLHSLSIFPTQQNLEHPAVSIFDMAIENCIRVRHGVTCHNLRAQDLIWLFQNCVVLESCSVPREELGGQDSKPGSQPEDAARRVEHGFQGGGTELCLSSEGWKLTLGQGVFHCSGLWGVFGKGKEIKEIWELG